MATSKARETKGGEEEPRRVSTLELHGDLAFQRREWQAQRVGQALLALVVALGVVGVFGEGLLAPVRAISPDGVLSVTYDRFARRGARTRLRIDLAAPAEGPHSVRISRGYIEAVEVRQITPAPGEVALTPEGTELVFELEGAGAVELDIWPSRAGRLDCDLVLDDRVRVSLWQWVWF